MMAGFIHWGQLQMMQDYKIGNEVFWDVMGDIWAFADILKKHTALSITR